MIFCSRNVSTTIARLAALARHAVAIFILALLSPTSEAKPPLADDATLSHRLIGTWHQYRHDTQYRADGTWMLDPQDREFSGGQNTHGKWRIEHGKLIETWRFQGESRDSSTVDEIIQLEGSTLKFRTLSQSGSGRPTDQRFPSATYTSERVTKRKPAR